MTVNKNIVFQNVTITIVFYPSDWRRAAAEISMLAYSQTAHKDEGGFREKGRS
jgi:hypothetical protein